MIRTERLLLSRPEPDDAPAFAAYVARNEAFHAPWTPPRPAGFFDEEYWRERFVMFQAEERLGLSLRFLLRDGDDVAGVANFTQIFRGPLCACTLGYALDQPREGRGLMDEALRALLPHVFDVARLHRIQANHLPENLRSARLLRRLGFMPEGYARDYLFIGGAWRDHVLTALVNPLPFTPAL
jgi:ribosomal-protein-alanine N-acetyltransferase